MSIKEKVAETAQLLGYEVGTLTLGETFEIANKLDVRVSDVVIAEACERTEQTVDDVLAAVEKSFAHNLYALNEGLSGGKSFLLGHSAANLSAGDFDKKILDDVFLNKAIVYTLGAQVGNHLVGLQPCAGTGDSCPYTGLFRAIREEYGIEKARRAAAVMLKVGTIFREGKSTTGCNMEGFGAGSASSAAALVELRDGGAQEMERAIVLAISPTIANPCTPRVMVPGLCATHICGAILIGNLSAGLALNTDIPVPIPVDVMLAMASTVHQVSAEHVVPVVNDFMRPFFKTRRDVDEYVDEEILKKEQTAAQEVIERATKLAKSLSANANPITAPFGDAVVGGSSQAVGSPTNAARIAHELCSGEIKKVKIELYPELFARRAINVPGVLMGAVYGASTSEVEAYTTVMERVLADDIEVELLEVDDPQLQRVTITATEQSSMVDALNRGGGRLVLRDATPSLEEARNAALKLGIVIVD